jgi:hypothetical protein
MYAPALVGLAALNHRPMSSKMNDVAISRVAAPPSEIGPSVTDHHKWELREGKIAIDLFLSQLKAAFD